MNEKFQPGDRVLVSREHGMDELTKATVVAYDAQTVLGGPAYYIQFDDINYEPGDCHFARPHELRRLPSPPASPTPEEVAQWLLQ